jgi:hypothetical protein
MKESGLSEKLNQKIEAEATKASKRMVYHQAEEKLGELDDQTEKHLSGLQSKLSHGIAKAKLPLLASVYFLIVVEHLPVLFMLVLVYFISTIISLILTLVVIIVAIIYLVSYLVIYRFTSMVRKGGLGFFFALLLSCCEAIFMAYLCQVVTTLWLLLIVGMMIVALLIVTILAKVLKDKFNVYVALLVASCVNIGLYAIYMLLASFDWTTIIVSFILVQVYQLFLIVIVVKLIKQEKIDDEDFRTAIFLTLLVYKKKIDFTIGLVYYAIKYLVKCCKKKENY